ncbi:MAG: hypothetical protein ACN6RG_11970 [Stenotrophomonas sp.]
MKITNNHKGPLGLPDGTILPPGEATPIANWDALKGNAVVQGWLKGKILKAEGDTTAAPPPASLTGSNVLPSNVDLAEGVTLPLGDVVRKAHEASGLSIADWNALDDSDREARLAATVLELQATAEADAEAKKGEAAAATVAADATAAAEAEKAKVSTTAQTAPVAEKDALLARAKALGIDAKGTWGVAKLEASIAEAEAKKGEG